VDNNWKYANQSRFEVDLNRPREKALKLWWFNKCCGIFITYLFIRQYFLILSKIKKESFNKKRLFFYFKLYILFIINNLKYFIKNENKYYSISI